MNLYKRELTWLSSQNIMNQLAGKVVLLTGATGMVGKCLIDAIMLFNNNNDAKIHVVALSRNQKRAEERLGQYWNSPEFTYVKCDVNEKIPECGEADYIIHAASNTHPLQYVGDSIGTISANILGTKNLLDYAVTHHTNRFAFLSSVEIYGENRGDIERFDESYLGYIDCNTLRSGYPESKRVGESLCNAYAQTYHLDFVIPRLSRCYGPTMLLSDSKAISQFIKKAAAKEDIVLKSEGNQKYSYSFVTDVTSGILYALLNGKTGEAYNIADSASDITLKELAEELATIARTKVIFELPQETEQKGYSKATKAMLCADKLEELGWKPRIHIKEGLSATVDEI